MAEYKMNPSCIPNTSSVTEATWKKRIAEGGWFVKIDGSITTATETGVTFLADDDLESMGRLIGWTGSVSRGTFRVTVENCGVRGYAQGGASGSFAEADYGRRMKGKNGKLIVDDGTATKGNMFLVGGTKAEPAVAWQWPN